MGQSGVFETKNQAGQRTSNISTPSHAVQQDQPAAPEEQWLNSNNDALGFFDDRLLAEFGLGSNQLDNDLFMGWPGGGMPVGDTTGLYGFGG